MFGKPAPARVGEVTADVTELHPKRAIVPAIPVPAITTQAAVQFRVLRPPLYVQVTPGTIPLPFAPGVPQTQEVQPIGPGLSTAGVNDAVCVVSDQPKRLLASCVVAVAAKNHSPATKSTLENRFSNIE
jgi:hypothetical protein